MSLQVWLPLNGDLHNQGLSNLTFSTLSSTYCISDNSGKIGKCYKNDAPAWNRGGLISNTTINLGQQQSAFCWVNFTTLNSSSSLGGALISQHRHTANKGMGLNIKYVSSTTGYLTVSTGNGSSRTYNAYCATTLMNAGTWYHVGYTYDGSNIRLYVNGNLEKTQAYSGMSISADYLTIFNWSMASSSGSSAYTNYRLNGYLNDVRLYNHCLSSKEVKELARGLVLNYQLKDFFPLNLVKYDKNIYTESDGSKWIRIFHHNNPASKLFAKTDIWASGVYKDEDRWFDIYPIVQSLTTFEFMVKQKQTSSATEVKYRWIQNKSPLTATYNDVKPDAVTRITTSGYTNGNQGGLWRSGHANTHMVIANSNSGNWYGATGCWVAYNGGIPGYPNTVITTGYIDLYIKISDYISNIIYDCSGYCNNGIAVGDLTITTNSSRYNTAIYLNASGSNNHIETNNELAIPTTAISVSFWVKANKSTNQVLFADPKLEFGLLNSLGYVIPTASSAPFNIPNFQTNEWNHVVVIRENSNYKLYINGVEQTRGSSNNNYVHNSTKLYLFNRSYNNNYAANATMSDFRVYATALSAAAVKELYQTSLDTSSGSPKARGLE